MYILYLSFLLSCFEINKPFEDDKITIPINIIEENKHLLNYNDAKNILENKLNNSNRNTRNNDIETKYNNIHNKIS